MSGEDPISTRIPAFLFGCLRLAALLVFLIGLAPLADAQVEIGDADAIGPFSFRTSFATLASGQFRVVYEPKTGVSCGDPSSFRFGTTLKRAVSFDQVTITVNQGRAVIDNTRNLTFPGREVWIQGVTAAPALNSRFWIQERVNASQASFAAPNVPDGTYSGNTIRLAVFQQITVSALQPQTRYCFAIQNAERTLTSSVLEAETLADSRTEPQPPQPPQVPPMVAPPPITGSTYLVLPDCSNLQAQLDAAAQEADASGQNPAVLIPAGAQCHGTYLLTPRDMSKTDGGWVIVRSAAPDQQLPPEGVRATSYWQGRLPALISNRIGSSGSNLTAALRTDLARPTKRWWVMGLELTYEATCDGCREIAQVMPGSPIRVRTAVPHGYATNQLVQVFGVNGVPAANGSRRVNVTGPDTLELVGTESGAGDSYQGGGMIATDPRRWDVIASLALGSEQIVLDRVLIHGQGFPSRSFLGLVLHCRECGVINSAIYNINNWRGVAPGETSFTASEGGFLVNCINIDISAGGQQRIENNYIEGVGILIFAQEGGATPMLEDVIIRRNLIETLPRYRFHPQNPQSDGRYYAHRQQFELKRGRRILIEGNQFIGNHTDIAWPGPTWNLSSRGQTGITNQIADIDFHSNIVYQSSGGFQLTGLDGSEYNDTLLAERIRLRNNLLYEVNGRRCVAFTTAPNCMSPSQVRGFQLMVAQGVSDFIAEHNTFWDFRGSGPTVLILGGRRGWRSAIRKNIFSLNLDQGLGGIIFAGELNSFLPPPANAQAADVIWRQWFFSDGFSDPHSKFENNLIVPGVRDTNNPAAYTSTNPALNLTRHACENGTGTGGFAGFLSSGNICAGANPDNNGNETAAARFAAIGFESLIPGQEDFSLKDSSPYAVKLEDGSRDDPGIRMMELIHDLGRVMSPELVSNGRSASIRYTTPTSQACAVDYGTLDSGAALPGNGQRILEDGFVGAHQITLSGLLPATDYAAWLLCPGGQFYFRWRSGF